MPGFVTLTRRLKQANEGVTGTLYELQVAARFKRQGKNIAWGVKVGGKEVDLIADGVHYNLKAGASALNKPGQAVVEEWVNGVLASGVHPSKVKFLVAPGGDIAPGIQKFLDGNGIDVLRSIALKR